LTLLSLGTLPEDASPSAFLEKFSSISGYGDERVVKVPEEKIPVTYDVPIVMNDRVKKSILYFQTVAREAFTKYLERSGAFIPVMREILKQHELPEDIVYLPIIESGFNCKAYSWARASGPWQFIASTGRLYGLNRDWWHDERRDFIKSTHAAAKFLKHLYEKFGSWELALAAYNGGPGRIDRTIRRQKTTNFWDMDLRKQTEDYVPFYMAATIIAKNPEMYGFQPHYDDPIDFDEVVIDKCLDLNVVAKSTGVSVDHIKFLNPEILRGYTPPSLKSYRLRIPKGTKDKFLAELPDMKSPQETSWVKHKIRRGETVSTIARRYGVSQYAIFQANNLHRRSKIYAGKTLIVPVPLGSSPRSTRSNRTYEASDGTYKVRRGDTLWDIARAFSTSTSELRRLNYLGNSSRIYVGQVLRIPGNYASSRKSSPTVAKTTGTVTHKVKRGDTLWDIARKYGTTTAKLRRLNNLSRSSRIYVGQSLYVSRQGDTGGSFTYVVRRGDTLSDIARAFGTTVRRLQQLNNITDVRRLQVGMRLQISD
jgi:membrane-bound lytic murein transglycosylase D